MNSDVESLLQDVYIKTTETPFVNLVQMEICTSFEVHYLRELFEDLKGLRYVVEQDEGFTLTNLGREYSRSNWG